MIVYWRCLTCDATGQYLHKAKGEATGKGTPDEHVKATGHGTMTSIRPPR